MDRTEITRIRTIQETIESAVKEAGLEALSLLRKGVKITDPLSFVTNVDHISDKILINRLKESIGGNLSIFSEESGGKRTNGLQAIIDAIDGTLNYYSRDDFWGISVAIWESSKPIAAVIYQPAKDIMFRTNIINHAARSFKPQHCKEKNIELNFKTLKVSGNSDLGLARVWTDWIKGNPKLVLSILEKLNTHTKYPQIRVCCTISMMQLAQGKIDGLVHPRPMPEDVAAAIPIVEKSGGKITDLNGNRYDIFSREVMVASNGLLHKKLLEILQ